MIDLRSDTVTQPDAAMRRAMADAEVGDDVYGEDPTVNRLQSMVAERLVHEAALFLPSGTQSNLVALLTHCARGDEYIVGADAHTYLYEGGGAAVLGGIQPQTVPFQINGELDLDEVAAAIKADDVHFARSRLLCLENTQHGRVQLPDYFRRAEAFARRQGLRLHLDGARLANASVASDVELSAYSACCDSVSLCLSKGLGAPVGSVLVGTRAFIDEARRWRKVTGGGLRQAGVLAAAGIEALDHGIGRLGEDHEKARTLSETLSEIEQCGVREDWTQSNMVWLDMAAEHARKLSAHARSHGILLSAHAPMRLVLHRDVSSDDVQRVIEVFRSWFAMQTEKEARSVPVSSRVN